MPVTTEDGEVVLALVRGDDRLSESKLLSALRSGRGPSTDEEIRAAFGASGGSLGPVGFEGEVVADETLREGQFVAGANRDGFHLRGVEAGRDYEPRFADIREPRRGRPLPGVRRRAAVPDRDRGRAHLQLRRQVHRRRSTRPSSTRTAREKPLARRQLRDRPRARDGGGGRADATTRTGSPAGRGSIAPYDAPRRRAARPRGAGRGGAAALEAPGRACCSTTATCGPGRSSPTPT